MSAINNQQIRINWLQNSDMLNRERQRESERVLGWGCITITLSSHSITGECTIQDFNCFLLLDGFYKLPMYHKIKHNWIETKQDCLIATTLSHNIVWSHLSILSMKLTDY